MLLNVTVQKVALGPLHFDDREPVGANLNALLEKLKIDIIGQAHLAKMFGDRLITFGMVADRAQEAANCPGLLECQKPARFLGLVDHGVAAGGRLRSEEHTSELQSPCNLVCRLLLEKKKQSAVAGSSTETHVGLSSRRR